MGTAILEPYPYGRTKYGGGMGAAWVPLHAYPRRTQFFPKKKILDTSQVWVGYGLDMGQVRVGLNEAKLRRFGKKIETLYLSLSL